MENTEKKTESSGFYVRDDEQAEYKALRNVVESCFQIMRDAGLSYRGAKAVSKYLSRMTDSRAKL